MAAGAPLSRREEALALQQEMVKELETQDEDITIDMTLMNAIMVRAHTRPSYTFAVSALASLRLHLIHRFFSFPPSGPLLCARLQHPDGLGTAGQARCHAPSPSPRTLTPPRTATLPSPAHHQGGGGHFGATIATTAVPIGKIDGSKLIWTKGIGCDKSLPLTFSHDNVRNGLLQLLLACVSGPLYVPSEQLDPCENRMMKFFTSVYRHGASAREEGLRLLFC